MGRRHPRHAGLAARLSQYSRAFDPRRSGAHLITIGLVALSLWILTGFVGQIFMSAQIDRQIADLQGELAEIEAENESLATAVAFAESPAYAEQVAREQLGYAREGDIVIIPVPPLATPEPTLPTLEPVSTTTPQPNWRGWVNAFFPTSDEP